MGFISGETGESEVLSFLLRYVINLGLLTRGSEKQKTSREVDKNTFAPKDFAVESEGRGCLLFLVGDVDSSVVHGP